MFTMKVQWILLLSVGVWLLPSGLLAAPTHRLIEDVEVSVSGKPHALKRGTEVQLVSEMQGKAYVKCSLPNGVVTVVPLSKEVLEELTKKTPEEEPRQEPHPDTKQPEPSAPSTEPIRTEPKSTNHLALVDKEGSRYEGELIRMEPEWVVLKTSGNQVTDVYIGSLNKESAKSIETWRRLNKNFNALADPRIKPGETLSLSFPHLGASKQANPARFTVQIPENYEPDKKVPVVLFLGGGQGTDDCTRASFLVDSADYVMVAFPYPKALANPKDAIAEGHARDLIAFQKPMLERLQHLIPNTDPEHRIAFGHSNGAHMIGISVSGGWHEFVDYFSGFILHEGGLKEGDFGDLRRKDVLCMMGAKSDFRAFAEMVVRQMKSGRVKPDVHAAEGEGHGLGSGSKEAAAEWIAELRKK